MIESKKKIKIDIAIFTFIFVALIFFCLSPLFSKIFKTTSDLTSKKNTLKNLKDQITALQDFQNNNLTYQEDIQNLNRVFVSTQSPVEFIEFIEKLANNQGLKILLSSVRDVSEKKVNRLTTSFQITITGDYPAVLLFLKKLEQSVWLIKVDQVDIDRDKEGQVILKLEFKTFSNYLGTTL